MTTRLWHSCINPCQCPITTSCSDTLRHTWQHNICRRQAMTATQPHHLGFDIGAPSARMDECICWVRECGCDGWVIRMGQSGSVLIGWFALSVHRVSRPKRCLRESNPRPLHPIHSPIPPPTNPSNHPSMYPIHQPSAHHPCLQSSRHHPCQRLPRTNFSSSQRRSRSRSGRTRACPLRLACTVAVFRSASHGWMHACMT